MNGIDTKLAVLEERLKNLAGEVEHIKMNHLAHIDEKLVNIDKRLNRLDVRLAYYAGGVVAVGSIINLIVNMIA